MLLLVQELFAQVSTELIRTPKFLMSIPGLNEKDCELLWHGLGTLANISQASVEDILERTPLKRIKALAIVDFFSRDTEALD
jgi:excinuclease UvrABC nuclease subunit